MRDQRGEERGREARCQGRDGGLDIWRRDRFGVFEARWASL
jgi:hypothetical protein